MVVDSMDSMSIYATSKHIKSGYYWPASETPSKRRFAGRPIVARVWMLAVNADRSQKKSKKKKKKNEKNTYQKEKLLLISFETCC